MSEAVSITRRAVGMIGLRCDFAEPRLAAALAKATGCALPAPRRIAFGADGAAAWMSPDEALLFVPLEAVAGRLAEIGAALASAHHLALDLSDARTVFRIEGAGAREVLAQGAPVDLAREAFGPGDFRRTRLGQVAAAFWMPEPGVFELMCFRSVAAFVADWLAHAARPGALPGVLGDG